MNQLPEVEAVGSAGVSPAVLGVPPGTPSVPSVASCKNLSFGIPAGDRDEFGRLPHDAARAVLTRLAWMQTLHTARKKQTACKALAARPGFPLSFDRLRALYYTFAKSGDWRDLLDSRRAPARDDAQHSHAFAEFVKELCERNQRKFAPAYAELLNIWRTHYRVCPATGKLVEVKQIPGYKEWPKAEPDTDLPHGWTYSTLSRMVRDRFAAAAARQGRTASAAFRPQVPVTREYLRVGQRVFIDDQWYDVEVNFLGSRRSVRPLGLDILDHCSGCFIAHGFRPRLRDEAAGINRSIKIDETRWLLVHYLTNIGYRGDTGSVIAHEHGTANFERDFKKLVTDLTHGKVTFEAGGLGGDPAFAGQFEGQSRGNFKFKAPLESAYNLVRNRQAALPGATGHDRNPPEELYGRKAYNDRLLAAAEALPLERRRLLQFPLLDWHDFIYLALHFYDAIDRRTDHDLQGWQRLGFLRYEYRLATDAPWRPMSELTIDGRTLSPLPRGEGQGEGQTGKFHVEQRDAILALLKSQPHLARVRKLSPREAWDAHARELTRLPDSMVGILLGQSEAKVATVTNEGYFRLLDQELDPEPIQYLARIDGRVLPRGEEFLVFQNPFQPDRLIVHERSRAGALGGYLGTAKLWGRVDVLDTAAIQRRCGEVAKIEAELLRPVAARGADLIRQKIAMHKNNAAVLAGQPITAEEKAKARILNGAIKSAPDALEALPNNENLEEVQSLSPGLRGTSYPGDSAPDDSFPLPRGEGQGEGQTSEGQTGSSFAITEDELSALPIPD